MEFRQFMKYFPVYAVIAILIAIMLGEDDDTTTDCLWWAVSSILIIFPLIYYVYQKKNLLPKTPTPTIPEKSNLYTRTGDLGFTSLYNGDRVSKGDDIFVTLGFLDVLNVKLGCVIQMLKDNYYSTESINLFKYLQSAIISISSVIATPNVESLSQKRQEKVYFNPNLVEWIEREINEMDSLNPPLREFILPGGSPLSCTLQDARCMSRMAEVSLNKLSDNGLVYPREIFKFINRMSDLLFAAARRYNTDKDVLHSDYPLDDLFQHSSISSDDE